MGWAILLLTMCTDNPLTYALWVTNPLFALTGAAYGVATRRHCGDGLDNTLAVEDDLHVTLVPLPDFLEEGLS
jgi:hypothetical protein